MRAKSGSIFLALIASALCSIAHAQVVTDGSLGTRTTISGPSYFIGANLGQQRGGNLFHSFAAFNISTGQTALFDTTPSIANVIARVTGGGSSTINGAISANANLYLINPQGILFGANASLNISGSFYATTGDYLKLADGERFYSSIGPTSVLTVAAPAAFGFLDNAVAPIVAQDSVMSMAASRSLSLIGGHVTLSNAAFSVPNGRVNIAAVAAPGEVTIGPAALTLTGFSALGDVQFTRASINANNEETADVYIRGGRFVMENQSAIFGVSTLSGVTHAIDIDADVMQLRGSGIVTGATGSGAGTNTRIHARQFDVGDGSAVLISAAGLNPGGDIAIVADDFRVSGSLSLVGTAAALGTGRAGSVSIQAKTVNIADGAISAVSGTAGLAGSIDVAADSVTLTRGGGITSSATSSGGGGRINLRARDLTIDGTQGTLNTGVSAVSTGSAVSAGNAGAIAVDVDSLILRRGIISSSTGGPGRGGDIAINARSMTLDDSASITTESGVSGQQGSPPTFGAGGALSITAQSLQVLSGSRVSASTFGNGAGGTISVTSNSLLIDQVSSTSATGIVANTGSVTNSVATGSGGNLVLRVANLEVRNQGLIGANTYGSGIAGRIDVTSDNISLTNAGAISASSFGVMPNAGRANDIVINAGRLDVSGGAQIANSTLGNGAAGRLLLTLQELNVVDGGLLQASSFSSTSTPGAAGDIFINSNDILIDGGSVNARSFGAALPGGIVMSANRVLLDNNAVLSATSIGGGNAGNIVISVADSLEMLDGSRIVTEALNGSGGNIRLLAGNRIVLRESLLSTSVLGPSANGGNIVIDPIFVIVDNSQIIARAVGGIGGKIDITTRYLMRSANSAVDASSRLGINGQVQVAGADVDLNADIAALPMDFLDARQWLATACASRQGGDVSQFTVNGRDGVYRSPFDWSGSPLSLDFKSDAALKSNLDANASLDRRGLRLPQLSFVPTCLYGPG